MVLQSPLYAVGMTTAIPVRRLAKASLLGAALNGADQRIAAEFPSPSTNEEPRAESDDCVSPKFGISEHE